MLSWKRRDDFYLREKRAVITPQRYSPNQYRKARLNSEAVVGRTKRCHKNRAGVEHMAPF